MIAELHLLLPLLLVVARLTGAVVKRAGMPPVVGEIAAGLLLGPMWIGALPTEAAATEGFHTFHEFAQIGLCVLLFRVGLETDLKEILRIGRSATGVAVSGMVYPFILGSGVGLLLGWPWMLTIFVGATLTATSIGVTASVLDEVGGHGSREGRVMMGAAIMDDVLGLLLLAGIVAWVTPGQAVFGAVSVALVQAMVFMAAGVFLGPWLVRAFVRLSRWAGGQSTFLVLSFAYLLLMAWTAHEIGLAMIIGAYAAGLAFGGHPEHEQLNKDLRPLIDLLTPLFFILIGASIELAGFNPLTAVGREAWFIFFLLFAAAIAGKLLSPALLKNGMNRMAIGSGMMPRGEVGFVFAQVGLTAGVLDPGRYSILTLVLVATTVLGPLLLRRYWNSPDEAPTNSGSTEPELSSP